MPAYRFYLIAANGHVAGPPTEHIAPSDAAAVKKANEIIDGHDIEIWESGRIVAYLTPDEKPSSPQSN